MRRLTLFVSVAARLTVLISSPNSRAAELPTGGQAEKSWNHDAFFDYMDRWMYEDDTAFVKAIKEATGRDRDKEWARQGLAWDAFVNEMWARHRPGLQASTEGWKQKHDDGYYRTAIAKLQE